MMHLPHTNPKQLEGERPGSHQCVTSRCVSVHVLLAMCIYTCGCVCTCGWTAEAGARGLFGLLSIFFFLKQGLSLNVELTDLARLIGQGAPEIPRSLS